MAASHSSTTVQYLNQDLTVPRSVGRGFLSSKAAGNRSVIDDFRCSGALRVLFPRAQTDLPAVLINTSGGLTSGDTFDFEAIAQTGSTLTLSTQAAERGYRAQNGPAITATKLTVEAGARLNWMPQELILFDGCDIERSLTAYLDVSARFLFVEPVIFGRTAMQETVRQGRFFDTVSIYRDGEPLFLDRVRLDGDIDRNLMCRAVAGANFAMASLVYIAPDASGYLKAVRTHLPKTGGASLLDQDVLATRIVAPDGFELRRALLPILDLLSQNTLPKTWRL